MAGPDRVLYPIDLELDGGSINTLLGPIRAGKTSLMRVMAGLDPPTSGRILDGGVDITRVDVRKRSVSMVYQQFINYPSFTVYRNIASPLVVAGVMNKRDRDARVRDMAGRLGLTPYLTRLPGELSGGQQQRVALARALVNRPAVLLLDEPLGALDLKLRRAMQTELRHLNRSVGITFIYVTHDQEEALTMSDRIAVMRGGRILQLGTAQQIYEQPATRFVADFIGETSFLEGTLLGHADGLATVGLPAGTVVRARCTGTWAEGSAAAVAIRPERIALLAEAAGPAQAGENGLEGRIEDAVFSGATIQYRVRLATGTTLLVRTPNSGTALAAGTPVAVRWAAAHCSVLAP